MSHPPQQQHRGREREASPSPEAGLFFASPSPPPDHLRRDSPADDVPRLVEKANQVTTVNPAIANFMTRNKGNKFAFLSLVRSQVELIKARSQDFRDAQVTTFDKALLQLTANGKELDKPTVAQFFAEQYLGIRQGAVIEASRILERSVHVGQQLKLEQKNIAKQAYTQQDKGKMFGSGATDTGRAGEGMMNVEAMDIDDTKLARLYDLYGKAKQDFEARSNNNLSADELMPAAKFLRDTAENTIQYLKDNQRNNPEMEAELQATYNMAKATVVSLVGGKKRKFDTVDLQDVKNLPRGPSLNPGIGTSFLDKNKKKPMLPLLRRQLGPGGQHVEHPTTASYYAARDFGMKPIDRYEPAGGGNVHFPYGTHGHPSADYSMGGGPPGGYDEPRGRNVTIDRYVPSRRRSASPRAPDSPRRRQDAPDEGPTSSLRTKKDRFRPHPSLPPRPPPVGRGPSGVPFGYARQVDSYKPNKEG